MAPLGQQRAAAVSMAYAGCGFGKVARAYSPSQSFAPGALDQRFRPEQVLTGFTLAEAGFTPSHDEGVSAGAHQAAGFGRGGKGDGRCCRGRREQPGSAASPNPREGALRLKWG